MTVCVFTGPTLAPADGQPLLDAVYLPPARQGDVYRAALRHRPRAMGLVDGYFQEVPSVWHKEILWAMAQGIQVFGSASMGALRAAELAAFGMRGVGRIFEAYRDGHLSPYEDEPFEDDDEVAVLHGPPETGFAAVSEAMVNMRCTLAAAARAGVIAPATRDALVRIGKGTFYPGRSYEALLAAAAGLPGRELDALRAWLPAGRVDQKRGDALAMLAAIRAALADGAPPPPVTYVFERSDMWMRAAESFRAGPPESGPAPAVTEEMVLDELRLDGTAYPEARRAGLLRMLALQEDLWPHPAAEEAARRRARDALRGRLGLGDRAALEAWMAASDLDGAGWARLVDQEARLQALEAGYGDAIRPHVLDHLRATGAYARHAARVRAKRCAVEAAGGDGQPLDDWDRSRLTAWYLERVADGVASEDLAERARRAGFPDLETFYRALWREYVLTSRPPPRDAAPPPAGRPPGPAGA